MREKDKLRKELFEKQPAIDDFRGFQPVQIAKYAKLKKAKCTLERDPKVWLDHLILKVYKLQINSKTLAKARNRDEVIQG